MYNVIVKSSLFYGKDGNPTIDKRGKKSVIMSPVFGSMPKTAQVIAGTIAERLEMEVGKCYFVQIERIEDSDIYGPQFRHKMIGEISPLDLATKSFSSFGEPQIIEVKAKKEEEENKPKNDSKKIEEILNANRTVDQNDALI